ncbi:Gp15 family bacteriophage protein [Enterococcus mundtii]|uniref:Gp15 family bacteriophage protein n=1 Tax=Enterococcus mundtii TaxID=53346 RepID=UPI00336A9069
MRLNDPSVTTFFFEGNEYSVDLAFDLVLDAFDALRTSQLTDSEKAGICLDLLIGEGLYSENVAIGLWNALHDSLIKVEQKPFVEYDYYGEPLKVKEEEKLLDLDKDAEAIYASFVQAYNIDLIDQQGMLSWSKFRALLHNLPSETPLKRIMQIRAWKPGEGDSAEFKKEMSDLQRYYALDEEEDGND